MTEPIRYPTVRWQCPFCLRTRAKRPVIREHIAHCYHNPAARGCLTCDLRIEPSGDGINEPFSAEDCRRGVEMPDRGLPVHCHLWSPDDQTKTRVLPLLPT